MERRRTRERRDALKIVWAFLAVLAAGTVGYMAIEGWTFLESLFMTIITVSTVGYREVHPLSDPGRIFSSFLIVGGVGVSLYGLTMLVQYLVEGHLTNTLGRRRMLNKVSKLKEHFIICGYGRVGKVVTDTFRREGSAFVVVTPEADANARAEADGCLCLQGDPSDYETLRLAGIERARGLLALADDDATNVLTIVSARKLSPDVFIISRATAEESVSKLEVVGANRATNPYRSEGERIARFALYPLVADFIEKVLPGYGSELALEDVEIPHDSLLVGKTVREAQSYSSGASVLAIRKSGKETIPKPSDETVIESGDRLILLGDREQLRVLEGTK